MIGWIIVGVIGTLVTLWAWNQAKHYTSATDTLGCLIMLAVVLYPLVRLWEAGERMGRRMRRRRKDADVPKVQARP